MKYLFYFGHPAQYLFLRETIKRLTKQDASSVVVLIKSKDVLEALIKADCIPYKNILPLNRGLSYFAVIFSLFKRMLILFPLLLKEKPNLLVSTDASLAILGKLLGIRRIAITEDDYNVIKNLAMLTYPFTNHILCPKVCEVGNYERKKIGYDGYMKLSYLHPNVFQPNPHIISKYHLPKKYVLIRLAQLTAHHDFGALGVTFDLLDKIINVCEHLGFSVFISSEIVLNEEYNRFVIKILPSEMHSLLAYSSLLISDSQSMSVEAAMLGVPSLRYSSFAGKISVLEELEHKYKLTEGVNPSFPNDLINKTKNILMDEDRFEKYKERRKNMLSEKIDVSAFITWFLENYPKSVIELNNDPLIQNKYKEQYNY